MSYTMHRTLSSIKTVRLCIPHLRCLQAQNATCMSSLSLSVSQQHVGVPTEIGTSAGLSVCSMSPARVLSTPGHGVRSSSIGGLFLPDCTQRRYYMKKKTLKILPTKPLSFDYAGDITTEGYPLDKQELKVEFEGVDSIESLDETVRKLLTVEFGDGHDKQKRMVRDIVSKVREHPLDVRSMEVLIAYQTVALRNQMQHVLEFRKDKAAKSLLVMRIQARRKHMKRLRRVDMDKFLWLCKELQIKYLPIPQYHHKLGRRATLKKEAREAAIAVKKEKMHLFQERLEQEQQEFLAHKERELGDIEEKLKGLKLEPNSYLGKFFQAVKEENPELIYEKPERPMKRREMILMRKFKLAEQRAAERNKEI